MSTLLIDKIRDVLLTEGTLAVDTLAGLPTPGADNINKLGIVRNAPDKGLYYSNGTSWLPVPVSVPAEPPISVAATRLRIVTAGASEVVESSVGASGAQWPVYNFTDGTGNPRIAGMVWVPTGWASVQAHIDWSVATVSATVTRWTGELQALTGALANPTDVFAASAANPGAAVTPTRTSIGTVAVTGGQWYLLTISRNNGHAADTYTGTASLHGITLTRTA